MGVTTNLYAVPAAVLKKSGPDPGKLHRRLLDDGEAFRQEHGIRHLALDKAWYDLEAPLCFCLDGPDALPRFKYADEAEYGGDAGSAWSSEAIGGDMRTFLDLFLRIAGSMSGIGAFPAKTALKDYLRQRHDLSLRVPVGRHLVLDEASFEKAFDILWDKVRRGYVDTPAFGRQERSPLDYPLAAQGWDEDLLAYLFGRYKELMLFQYQILSENRRCHILRLSA